MSKEEEITRLKMRVTELEKQKAKDEKAFRKLTEENATLKEDVEVLTRVVRSGEEKLRLELFLKFGSSSEKYRKMFNIPAELLLKAQEGNLSAEEEKVIEEAKDRLKQAEQKAAGDKPKASRNRNPEHRNRGNGGGRQTFDPSYPREKQEFKVADKCAKCGTTLVDINNADIHEYIDLLENNLSIIQQIKNKGYCPCCGERHDENGAIHRDIITASAPERFIPGGLAGDSLIAASIVDKFLCGLSVTRISKRFRNLGVDLSEQNFSNWHMRAGSELNPIADAIKDFILSQKAVNADETRVQVLDEPGRKDTLDSWMWVICSATPDKPAAYFQYDVSRSSDVFKEIVGNYSGFLQADCYVGYQTKRQNYQFTLALCLAHLRRKFINAQKAGAYQEGSPGYITLDRIITTIGKIYKIDSKYRTLWLDDKLITEQQFIRTRKEESIPLFEKLSKWIRGRYDLHRDDEFIMEGMDYYLNSELMFRSYLDCANLNPDNSRSERIIRAFSTVRMNVLFAGSPAGANTLATLETILQTANLWDLNLHRYITYLLKEVTKLRSLKASSVDYSQFLPWNLTSQLRQELDVHSISIKKKPV